MELTLTRAAAELAVVQLANRRYRGKDADAIQADAKERWNKLVGIGRRAFNISADLGVALEALKAASPHGTYLARLEKLGIKQPTADRFRQLACYRVMLPKNPPPELYGEVWTDVAAMEYGKTLLEMDNDIPAEERPGRATQQIRAKRSTRSGSQLAKEIMNLENKVRLALQNGDDGAEQALDGWLGGGRRLDRFNKDLIDDADASRDDKAT